jgi:hypothetical protein
MKTLPEIVLWLKQPDHIRIILVEVEDILNGGSAPIYLSNKAFTSTATDTPANTYYEACINGGISFSESLDLSGAASLGLGEIELENTNGLRDSWLEYIWVNKRITIRLGDPRWTREDFYMIFDGIVSDISSRSSDTLNIILLDKLERLNRPISEDILGGTGNNSDRQKPLLFGECFNVDPLLTDSVPNVLEYMIHNGPIEDIIEVRDSGLPVDVTKHLATGTFNLLRSPYGQITASIQGSKPTTYSDKIADIISNIVTNYGPTNTRLTAGDIHTTNFSTFNIANPQPVGVYCKERENILDVCQRLASSVGASVVFDSLGKLKLVKLDMAGSGTTHTVNREDVLLGELSISEKPIVKGAIKLNYCYNWTIQNSTSLAGGLPSNHVAIFDKDWDVADVTNPTTILEYKLAEGPVPEDTLLLDTTEAVAEANRRLALWSTDRYIVTMTCLAHLLVVELGDSINITNARYGMVNGKTGIIISIERDWIAGTVTIGALI